MNIESLKEIQNVYCYWFENYLFRAVHFLQFVFHITKY